MRIGNACMFSQDQVWEGFHDTESVLTVKSNFAQVCDFQIMFMRLDEWW